MSIRILSLIIVGCVTGSSFAEEKPQTFDNTVRPFLEQYCLKCHGEKRQKGERRFDRLTGKIENDNTLVDLQDVLDQLNLSEMPPKSADQPTAQERRTVIHWLTKHIVQYHQTRKNTAHGPTLRRLNSREYLNTLRDLLHLDMTMFDPTAAFPRDQLTEHLDNVGSSLVMSGYLLNRYLEAAEKAIEKVLSPGTKPQVQTWTFKKNFRQQPEIDQVHRRTNKFEWMTLYDVIGADKHEGAYGPILAFKEGVPFDGIYEIRLKAEAVNRLHPYDPKFLGTDRHEPLRLGIVAGNHLVGPLHKPQPIEPLLAEIDLEDRQKWYTVRVRLDAGYTPRFTFRNGLMDARNLWGKLVRKYPDQFPKPRKRGIVADRYNAIKFGKLPQIHIHEIEIKGPFYEQWPTKSHRAVLGDDWEKVQQTGKVSTEQMRKHLTTFASRAYRRPVQQAEIDRIMQVIQVRQQAGRSSLEAYGDGLKMVLCSPNFLYLEQPEKTLSAHALASRLSYFLWSSMPDQELLQLASSKKLLQSEVLSDQVERMLKSEKSDAFIEGFLGSWLTLRDLGATPPERRQFRAFYHYDLDSAMRRETHLFTRHLIDHNLSIANYLDSDFTFANKPLAKFYGVPYPKGEQGFQKVKVTDKRRGGLLGQASVLTVTGNGIDTSPVVRGVWLLENILGTPPSPPPPDVEPLDPDIRGAKTIRDQLNKHRSVTSCYDCHRKIDPLGFALENFDPIGNWRTVYGRRGAKVDASGELPNGKTFKDIVGLKKILIDQKARFAEALTKKLLAYALGRTIELSDRPEITHIVKELSDHQYGMRDLIKLIATSKVFRSQ